MKTNRKEWIYKLHVRLVSAFTERVCTSCQINFLKIKYDSYQMWYQRWIDKSVYIYETNTLVLHNNLKTVISIIFDVSPRRIAD